VYRIRYLDYHPYIHTPPQNLVNKTPQYLLMDLSEAFRDKSRGGGKFNSSTVGFPLYDLEYGVIDVKNTWVLLERGADYSTGLCKIRKFMNKTEYPYLDLNVNGEDLAKC
jgi:hypothetical protein